MIEQIQHALEQIPLLPSNITKLMTIVNDPKADSADLIKIVEQDPALSMQTLHICNSAYYSLPVEITSVSHAIRFLGIDTVAGLAMAAYLQGLIRLPKTKQINPWLNGIKKHLLATAQLSELISRETGRGVSPATAFTSGFLHDIGKLVFSVLDIDIAVEVFDRVNGNGLKLHEAEQEVLQMDHADAGASLAERWCMPEVILDVIRHHHIPFSGEYHLTLYVSLSDTMAHLSHEKKDISELFEYRDALDAMKEINLTEEQTTQLWEKWIELRSSTLKAERMSFVIN